MSIESSRLNGLDERGNITELYVSRLAKPAADMVSDFIFGLFRTSYSIIFRISVTRSALSGLWAECDAIPSHSNTTQNADTPSGAATSRCNWTSINPTPNSCIRLTAILLSNFHFCRTPSVSQNNSEQYLLICTNECTIFWLKYYTNISLLYNYTCSYMFRPLKVIFIF